MSASTIRTTFVQAGFVKLGRLARISMKMVCNTYIKSIIFLKRITEVVWQSAPVPLRVLDENSALNNQWNNEYKYIFSVLLVTPISDCLYDESRLLLSLKMPVLGALSSCGKKQLCQSCALWLVSESWGRLRFLDCILPLKADERSCISYLLKSRLVTSSGRLYMVSIYKPMQSSLWPNCSGGMFFLQSSSDPGRFVFVLLNVKKLV